MLAKKMHAYQDTFFEELSTILCPDRLLWTGRICLVTKRTVLGDVLDLVAIGHKAAFGHHLLELRTRVLRETPLGGPDDLLAARELEPARESMSNKQLDKKHS